MISFEEAEKFFNIDRDIYDDIIRVASATSAHPMIYEEGGRQFTVADLVMGRGSLKGGVKPNLSKAKPVSLSKMVNDWKP